MWGHQWIYWEKFDVFTEVWGNFVLLLTGLIMWFPAFFTRWIPGVAVNMSVFIHGIEASLAICFIAFIHFYNAHLRRSKFPMDMVIVTGSISESEFEEERPAEYERLKQDNALFSRQAPPASPRLVKYGRAAGLILMALLMALSVLITVSVFTDLTRQLIRLLG